MMKIVQEEGYIGIHVWDDGSIHLNKRLWVIKVSKNGSVHIFIQK